MMPDSSIKLQSAPANYQTDWQQKYRDVKGNFDGMAFVLEVGSTDVGDTLYAAFHGHYDVSPGHKPVLFASKFNTDGTITSSGPWFIGAGNHQTCLWLTTHNGKLYAGAGLTAGDAASPWGRSLYRIQIPDPTTPAFSTLASQVLLTYAIGREMEYYDAPAIRSIVRAAAADDYRWSSTILAIVKSTPFQMRRSGS